MPMPVPEDEQIQRLHKHGVAASIPDQQHETHEPHRVPTTGKIL